MNIEYFILAVGYSLLTAVHLMVVLSVDSYGIGKVIFIMVLLVDFLVIIFMVALMFFNAGVINAMTMLNILQ